MRCTDFVLGRTLTGMTKMAIVLQATGTGATSDNCSVTIYSGEGTSIVTTAPMTCTVPATNPVVATATGLTPFTLTAGVEYRECFCADQSGYGPIQTSNGDLSAASTMEIYSGIVANNGLAANACTGGATPPATTGALTALYGFQSLQDTVVVYVTKE
jgi:hypothetical protein